MQKQKKAIKSFNLRILSRHPSINGLRNNILISGKKVVYRHGSTTNGEFDYEINSVQSVSTSANKKKMKVAFDKAGVTHAPWIELSKSKKEIDDFLNKIKFPKCKLIVKNIYGSRGRGNYLIKTKEEIASFISRKSSNLNDYIVEEYKPYLVEYRMHIDSEGCFYTCRKMLKNDTPKEQRFQRHDDNCTWILETNPLFNKPSNWNEIVQDCVKALKSIGADILAFDVKCTSVKDNKDGKVKWILIESCAAPSMGKITLQKYKERLPIIIKNKYK